MHILTHYTYIVSYIRASER
uniref:Uncharacterized protein n=1 Tax=Rhizophora mucronata TaxID=61149 RepID=A0A2P2NVX2_RHIMU